MKAIVKRAFMKGESKRGFAPLKKILPPLL